MSRVHDALRRAEQMGMAPIPVAPRAPAAGPPPEVESKPEPPLEGLLAQIPEIPFTPAPEALLIDTARPQDSPSEEFRTLLADNSALVQGLFRVLWGHPPLGIGQIISRGRHPERDLSLIDGSLNAIQKVFVLEAIPAFAGVSAEEMLRLAAIAVEIGFSEGSSLFNEADPPALYALIAGELALESSLGDPVLVAGPSDVVGIYETFAGIPILRHARVTRSGTALRIDRDDLFDLLALRPDMIQQLFSALPGANASER